MTPSQVRTAANTPWGLRRVVDTSPPMFVYPGLLVRALGRTRDGRQIVSINGREPQILRAQLALE